MSQVIGVDGWKGGWVAVVLGVPTISSVSRRLARDTTVVDVLTSSTFVEILDTRPEAEIVAVDIPIGLMDRDRQADLEAKRFLGARRSSVFLTPPRAALEAETYAEAREIALARTGKSVSVQSYRLGPKILEVDALAREDNRIREVHPEVAFRALAGQEITFPKKTWNGFFDRRALLAGAGINVPGKLEGEAGKVPLDDVLDAAVAAWSACRILRGEARSIPDPPEPDADGYPTAIWY